MKFRQKLMLPIFPNPFCYVEVEGSRVRHRRYGRTRFDYELQQTSAAFESRGFWGDVFGYGDVRLKEASKSESVAKEVVNGAALRSYIHIKNAEFERQSKTPSARIPPANVTFGRDVLQLPALSEIFDRPLWVQHCDVGLHPHWWITKGDWVNRGDALCSFYIRTSSSKSQAIHINSPVSGLILKASLIFDSDPWGAILLPEDEDAPLPVSTMFGALCEICSEHRAYIFHKPRELFGHPSLQNERLDEAFAKQLEERYVVKDLLDPRFKDNTNGYDNCISELRRERPHLSQLLAHLVRSRTEKEGDARAGNRTAKPFSPERDSEENQRAERARSYGDIREARERLCLDDPFSRPELDQAHRTRKAHVDPRLFAQCDADYELLKPFAR